jgi:hypothetical protein
MSAPERVAALIIQNGNIYEDALGPKYEWLRDYWASLVAHAASAAARDRVGIFEGQAGTLADFLKMQAYLREHRPPNLIAVAA